MSSTSISEFTRMGISLPVFREGTWDDGIWGEARTYRVRDFKGKVVVDLGAHIGGFTTMAADGGAKRVYAYEAWKENFKILQSNVDGYENVEAHNCAVWKSNSPVKNVYFHDDFDQSNTGGGGVFEATGQGLEVRCMGLDDIIRDTGFIDILKIDIESSEFPVLFTSARLHMVRAIIGEYHHGRSDRFEDIGGRHWEYNMDSLKLFLEGHGFHVAVEKFSDDLGKFAAFRI